MIGLEAAVVEDSGGARSRFRLGGACAPELSRWESGGSGSLGSGCDGEERGRYHGATVPPLPPPPFSLSFCLLGLAPGAAGLLLAQGPRFCPLVVLGLAYCS